MGLLIPIEVRSMSFSFLLEVRILKPSLRFETFTITRFGPFLLLIQWQSSTLEGSTLTSNFPKIFKTVLSRVLLSFVSGMPVNSRHSHLEYWLLLQHRRSKLVTLSLKTELTCLATERSERSFSIFFFNNWKWKWMNRIRHRRKNVVGKQKFELIWKVISNKSNQFACY